MAAVTYGPEGSEIVKIGNTYYLGYEHDGMLLLWTIPNNDLSSVTDYVEGEDLDDYLRELGDSYLTATEDEYATNIVNGANIWKAGSIGDITIDADQREDVVSNTISAIDQAKNELPWWSDEVYQNLVFELMIESPDNWEDLLAKDSRFLQYLDDNDISKSEYNTRTTNRTDPEGRKDKLEQHVINIKDLLTELDAEMSEEAILYAANKATDGAWTSEVLSQQINAAVDTYSKYTIESDFLNVLNGGEVKYTKTKENIVQDLMKQWLPESLWDKINIADEAGLLRQSEHNKDKLVNRLKDLRYAQYNMYDRDIAWENIKTNKTSTAFNILGVDIKEGSEHWNLIEQLIQMNNVADENALVREYGINNNFEKPTREYLSSQATVFGTGEVPAANFREGRP